MISDLALTQIFLKLQQFASAAAVKSVEARVAPVDAQLPAGYEIQVPSFAGIANGVNFNISGTIEDVLLELERIHPGIDILAPGVLTGSAANETTLAAGPNEKVSDFVPAWWCSWRLVLSNSLQSTPMDLYCIPVGGQPWNPVTQGSVDKNRQLLYRLSFVNVGINPVSQASKLLTHRVNELTYLCSVLAPVWHAATGRLDQFGSALMQAPNIHPRV